MDFGLTSPYPSLENYPLPVHDHGLLIRAAPSCKNPHSSRRGIRDRRGVRRGELRSALLHHRIERVRQPGAGFLLAHNRDRQVAILGRRRQVAARRKLLARRTTATSCVYRCVAAEKSRMDCWALDESPRTFSRTSTSPVLLIGFPFLACSCAAQKLQVASVGGLGVGAMAENPKSEATCRRACRLTPAGPVFHPEGAWTGRNLL
jgi:hypothetical protein